MRILHKQKNTFYCFSPPVMIATCVIEIALFFYTLYRYKMTAVTRLAAATLGLLAIFQLSEFAVCGADAANVSAWSRIGYVAITMLPPLGIHLLWRISGRVPTWLVVAAYATGLGFAAIFGLSSTAFESHVCAGNYAIFQLASGLGGLYFFYYYAWLIVGIILSLYFCLAATPRIRKALLFHTFGYLGLLLPTGIVNTINPQTIEGIPSIMCGFAIIYALVLTFGIVPAIQHQKRSAPQKKRR